MTDLRELLEGATTIDVIDWPSPEVPATLVRAGYTVVAPAYPPEEGKSPYLVHEVSTHDPTPDDGTTYDLEDGARLSFRPLDALPPVIDIVSTYRPAEEQPDIVAEAIRLGARAVWVEPGEASSAKAREVAVAAGLAFVDGQSIAAVVRDLGIQR